MNVYIEKKKNHNLVYKAEKWNSLLYSLYAILLRHTVLPINLDFRVAHHKHIL
jgi:hypothetical protein